MPVLSLEDFRETAKDLLIEAAWDSFVKFLLAKLFAWAPLLGWGPIGFVVTQVAVFFCSKIYDGIIEFFGQQAIVIKREGLEDTLDTVAVELAVVAIEKGIDSEEYKNARIEHKKALSKFARFGKPANS